MKQEALDGMYLNGHIRELLERQNGGESEDDFTDSSSEDSDADYRKELVKQAKVPLAAIRKAVEAFAHPQSNASVEQNGNGSVRENGVGSRALSGEMGGDTTNGSAGETRRGVTSREMSGEMGGDTSAV